MIQTKMPIRTQLRNPWVWTTAVIISVLLANIGFMFDKIIQRSNFARVAAEFKADINQTLLDTSFAVQSLQVAHFNSQYYLADLASTLHNIIDISEYYFLNADGTYYAGNLGNPHQNFLVTQDDTDYISIPLSISQTELWQYHFLHSEASSPFLWPSSFNQDHWLITFNVKMPDETDFSIVAIEITPSFFVNLESIENLAYQFQNQPPKTFDNNLQSITYALKYPLTDRLWLLGNWTFPWISMLTPILGVWLFFTYLWLSHSRAQPKPISRWKELQSTLCDELNVMLFETNSESEIVWLSGQVQEHVAFSQLQKGQSIKHALQDQPKYLTYWQHSLDGEKLTYEIADGQRCLRVHQWPMMTAEGAVESIRVMIQDISDQRSLEQQIQHQQFHDNLTGLPNRQFFMEQVSHELHRAKRRQELVAVLAIEISGIGRINKLHGHKTSDLLLQRVSKNIHSALRSEDTLCRFSNDEFLICFNDYQTPEELQLVAERVITQASARIEIDGNLLSFFANVGIATFPRDAIDTGSLISNAITAMRHARQTGRNSLDYFSADNARVAHEKWQLEQDITKALNAHDFTLHYQPIFDLRSNRCIGAEALIRWPGTDLGPDQFIPLAEETGLIHNIGFWVIETAITQFQKWQNQGGQIDYISINLSVSQLKKSDFFTKLDVILKRLSFESGRVVLELTESVMMDTNKEMVKKLQALRDRGFHLAIDDFGTGFSSLNYLKHLPINYLKVDRSFVQGIPNNPHDTAICEAIIKMAIAMNFRIIAEGVETPDQMAWLSSKGVLFAQGYFYAHAVPPDEFKPYIGIR